MNRLFPILLVALLVSFAEEASAQVARIRDGDAVLLTIRGVPDRESQMINGKYKVDQNGILVGLPYLDGRLIRATGQTEGELSNTIAEAYRNAEIYTKATITAIVDSPVLQRKITIGGEVGKPGQQAYYDGIRLFDAYTSAGGATKFGQEKRVFVIREGKKMTFNLKEDADRTFRLMPGDTIEVDKKGAFEP